MDEKVQFSENSEIEERFINENIWPLYQER